MEPEKPENRNMLVVDTDIEANVTGSLSSNVKTPTYKNAAKVVTAFHEESDQEDCTPCTRSPKLGRLKSSGMKGKARRVVRTRTGEESARITTPTHIDCNTKRPQPITPSPRETTGFSFDLKVSSASKIRAMKKHSSSKNEKRHDGSEFDISPTASIMNTLSSLSLTDDKRRYLSSGARRVPLRSLSKCVHQTENLSPQISSSLLKPTYCSRAKEVHFDSKKRDNPESVKSLKNDFEGESRIETVETIERAHADKISIGNQAVNAIRDKIRYDKESKINEHLLDECISHQEHVSMNYHSSMDSEILVETPQKSIQSGSTSSSEKSKANDSFDSVSEHFQNHLMNTNVKLEMKRDGSVNPMSKTLSRNDAELLFRENALSRHFSFSGATSAFSAKGSETTFNHS